MSMALRVGVCVCITSLSAPGYAGAQFPVPAAPDTGQVAVLATVADMAIDTGHFRVAVRRLMGKDREAGDLSAAERHQVLDALIGARLIALEAQRRGLDRSDTVGQGLSATERDAVVALARRLEVEDKVIITAAEVVEYYQLWGAGEVLEPAHILLASREAAEQVLAELAAGADFGELATTRSRHGGSSLRQGSMGYLRKHLVPEEIRAHIWDLPAGAVYPEPIRTRMGYHVVKVLGRRHQNLAEQETAIRNFLGRKKRAILERDLRLALQAEYGYAWRGDTVARLIRQGPDAPGDSVLARWRGGELTAAEYRRRASGPDAASTDTAQVRRVVEDLTFDDLLWLAGRTRGWDRRPEVLRQVEEARLRLLGRALFASLEDSLAAEPEAVGRFFADHRDSYRGAPQVSVQEIQVEDQATADSLYALVVRGADMARLAERHSIRQETRGAGGIWRHVARHDPISATVYRLALLGEGLLEPAALPSGGFSVIRVLDKDPGPLLELAEAEGAVRQDLATVAMDEVIRGLRERGEGLVSVDETRLLGLR